MRFIFYVNIKEKIYKYSDGGQILVFEPNIENFVSTRARYRDLKSKD